MVSEHGAPDKRVPCGHEAGGPRSPQRDIDLHRDGGRGAGPPTAPAPGRGRQQERLLAPGGLRGGAPHRPLRALRGHAAAPAGLPHERLFLAHVPAQDPQQGGHCPRLLLQAGTASFPSFFGAP